LWFRADYFCCGRIPSAVSIASYTDSLGNFVGGTSEALSRAIELSVERSDHAAEGFGRSNQHRIVNCLTPMRRKQFSLLGHPKLLSHGASCPCVEIEQRMRQLAIRERYGAQMAKACRQ